MSTERAFRFYYAGLEDLRLQIISFTAQVSHRVDVIMVVNTAAWRSIKRELTRVQGETFIVVTKDGFESRGVEHITKVELWGVWVSEGDVGDPLKPGLVCELRTCERAQAGQGSHCAHPQG